MSESVDPIEEGFAKGEIVFKIIIIKPNGVKKDFYMVNTKEDYERKLCTHQFQPLLFVTDLKTRLAYLYGCLNNQYNVPREDEYLFMWRKIKTNIWNKWFSIKPYTEDIYKEQKIVVT